MLQPGVSVQLYTVRAAIPDGYTGLLKRLANIGFTDVEPFDFVAGATGLARALEETGLRAPSGHAKFLGEDVAVTFETAAKLGMRTVVQPKVDSECWLDRAGVEQTADALNRTVDDAAAFDLVVGYHNHWWEFDHEIEGRPALELFADLLDERIVLELDTYWVQVAGVDSAALLGRLGPRVTHLHLKDGPATRDTHSQVALGRGSLDIPAILAAAPGAARVLELDDCAGDVFDALADGLSYLAALEPQATEEVSA